MTRSDKLVNIVFRLVIFISAAATVAMICYMFSFIIDVAKLEENNYISDGQFLRALVDTNALDAVGKTALFFYVSMGGTLIAIIFSLLARKNCMVSSIFFRTISLTGIFVLQIMSMKCIKVFMLISDVFNKIGDDILHLTSGNYEDYGISESTINQIDRFGDTESGENAIIAFLCLIIAAFFIYLILTFTSIHSLAKKKPQYIDPTNMYYGSNMQDGTNNYQQQNFYQNNDNNYNSYNTYDSTNAANNQNNYDYGSSSYNDSTNNNNNNF